MACRTPREGEAGCRTAAHQGRLSPATNSATPSLHVQTRPSETSFAIRLRWYVARAESRPNAYRHPGAITDFPWTIADNQPRERSETIILATQHDHFAKCESSVICTGISSLTAGTYLITPKSERLSTTSASKPALGTFIIGLSAILLTLALSTIDLVTPCTLRSPVILRPSAPAFSTLVLLKVIVGYFVASRNSSVFKWASSFSTPVCRPSSGNVTVTEDLVRSAASSRILPSIFSSRAVGLEKPK